MKMGYGDWSIISRTTRPRRRVEGGEGVDIVDIPALGDMTISTEFCRGTAEGVREMRWQPVPTWEIELCQELKVNKQSV